jgi:hypothetical protein
MAFIPHDYSHDPPRLECPHCGGSIAARNYESHVLGCHAADDLLSTYAVTHPNSASARFAALIREAAERGAK